jgi:hypothetical protein
MFEKMRDRVNSWMHPKDKCPADKLYNLLFGQDENLPTTGDIENSCGVEISKRPVQVAVFQIGEDICDIQKLRTIIRSCRDSSDSEEVIPVSDGKNKVVLLFFCDTLWKEQVRQILEDIQKEFLAAWPDTRLYVTLGTIEDFNEEGEPSWRKSYRKAIGLQDYRYVKPKGKIIAYCDIIERRQMYPKGIVFHFDLLKKYLEVENPDLFLGWVKGIYSMLSEEGKDALGLRYHLTLEIVVNAVSLLRERGLNVELFIGPPESIIREVLDIGTLQGMQHWTETFLEKCHRIIQQLEVV